MTSADSGSAALARALAISAGRKRCTTASANARCKASGTVTTGDAKLTLKTTADAGWVMMDDGTIGDGSSGASTRTNPEVFCDAELRKHVLDLHRPLDAEPADLMRLKSRNVAASEEYVPAIGGKQA